MKPRVIPYDPKECLECLLHSRSSVIGRDEAARLIRMDRARAFVETFTRLAGGGDPLKGLKRRLNEAALKLVPGLGVQGYRGLLELMARANGVDWGMKDHEFDPGDAPRLLAGDPVYRGIDPGRAASMAREASTVAIVLDNSGEAVLDLWSAGRLMDLGHRVYVVARERPYEVDVTVEEATMLAEALGVDVEVYPTTGPYPVFHPESRGSPGWRRVTGADLVIVKGIANFEAAVENPGGVDGGLLFLLRAKCIPIASFFRVGLGTPIIASPGGLSSPSNQSPAGLE